MPRLRLPLGGRTLGSFLECACRLGRLGLRLRRRGGCSDRSRLRCLQLGYPKCLSRPALRHCLRVRLRACELRRARHLRHARRHLRLGSPALLLGPLRLLAEPATSQRLLLLLPLASLPFARLLLGLGLEGAGRQSVVIRAHQGSSGLIRAHQGSSGLIRRTCACVCSASATAAATAMAELRAAERASSTTAAACAAAVLTTSAACAAP